jgi:hypothetical protein
VTRASRREWLIVLALAIAIVCVLTYPTVPGLTTLGRVDSGDGQFSLWNIGWIDHALLTNPRGLFDANIFHPHRGTLAYSELNLVAGVLGLPAYAMTGSAIAALNTAVVLGLGLSVICMWALVRRLTGSSGAGLVAATAFTFCPFVHVHTAHIQLLMVFAFPLTLLAFHRLCDEPGVRSGLGLGAALAASALACAYYGIFAGLALGLAAVLLATRRMRYWAALGGAAVVAAALVLPVVVPYLRARASTGVHVTFGREEIQGYSATMATYLTSPSLAHAPINQGAAESVFPGVLLLALAAVGVVAGVRSASTAERRVTWTYLVIALVAFWASFGPALGLYSVLSSVVPLMSMLRTPVRFGIVVAFALAVLAGFGIRRLAQGRAWVPAVLLPLVVLELFVPWPLRAPPPVPRAYEMLAELPRGAVVELLFNYKPTEFFTHSRFLFGSTYHWQPLVNGYSDLIPPDFPEVAKLMTRFPDQASFDMLRARQVKYVVIHLDDYEPRFRDELLSRFPPYEKHLQRLATAQNTWLYEIVSWPERPGPG